MKPVRTWILIADASRSRVLTSTGRNSELTRIGALDLTADHASTSDIVSDKAGRTFDSAGPGRHAYEAPTDPHRALKSAFAQRLCELLDRHVQAKDLDRLVIVAPPVMLGELRHGLTKQTQAILAADLDKDLTKVPDQEVRSHLKDLDV